MLEASLFLRQPENARKLHFEPRLRLVHDAALAVVLIEVHDGAAHLQGQGRVRQLDGLFILCRRRRRSARLCTRRGTRDKPLGIHSAAAASPVTAAAGLAPPDGGPPGRL